MQYNLPKLNIPPEWTRRQQIEKIMEETIEVLEAIYEGRTRDAAREILDAMQTYDTLLTMLGIKQEIINDMLKGHRHKLVGKGYAPITELPPPNDTDPGACYRCYHYDRSNTCKTRDYLSTCEHFMRRSETW